MGGSTERCKFRKKIIGVSTTSSNNNTVKEVKLLLLQKHIVSAPPPINLKINSGATHNFREIGSTDLLQQPNINYNPAARVILPNGASMVSSATTHLPIPSLPPSATKSHGFNHLASGSLFSVGKVCDHNFTAVFDNNSVKIFKSTELNITALCPPIIQGCCNLPSQTLYSVSLPNHPA